ncbi:hypothetical protein [Scytonema sp. NUACC26]|uniref:hypothetical protein n=1 Tax=Scytonema sp. NUACC26 TaxID=3140176 RepID=UPI0034DBB4FA
MSDSSNTLSTPIPAQLEQGKDKEQIFQEFLVLANQPDATAFKPALLYKGIQNSPYQPEINNYPVRLKEQLDPQELIFKPYPKIGELPQIASQGLEFLHPDIKEACICVGRLSSEKIRSRWIGRNALDKNQFWSGTKIIPLLNIVSQLNTKFPHIDIDNCIIRDPEKLQKDVLFLDVATDIASYQNRIASSNSLAAMCKSFETWEGLELWVKKITGNQDLIFRGRYGELPYINQPELFDLETQKVLLKARPETPRGDNLVTAYDLVRFISMLAWHNHLPLNAQLPGSQWDSLEAIITSLGSDACRYTDLAIQALGLENAIASPTIISKLGNGFSDSRQSSEIVYIAQVQFLVQHPTTNNPPALKTVCMALRGVKPFLETNPDKLEEAKRRDAIELDARMATEVTEILRKVLIEELI